MTVGSKGSGKANSVTFFGKNLDTGLQTDGASDGLTYVQRVPGVHLWSLHYIQLLGHTAQLNSMAELREHSLVSLR